MDWIYQKIDEREIQKKAKLDEKSFIRNRKMNIKEHLIFIMNQKGKTLTMELREYGKQEGKKRISKQAYSKQRTKINPKVFIEINDMYVRRIYEKSNITVYNKGYILLGVDGSTNELPNSEELKEHYGISQGQKNSVGRVRAKVGAIYDCCNDIMITSEIDKYEVSEKEIAMRMIKRVKEIIPEEKTIMIFDRYYFGVEFAYRLEKMGQKYVMRLREGHYQKEREKIEESEEVEIKIRSNSIYYAGEEVKEELKRLGKIKVRIIKVELEEGEEYLVTNLSEEELPSDEAKEIYFKRWEIEKAFDVMKNKLQIENYSSRKVIGIEQEYYAGNVIYNIIKDIKRAAEREKTRKGKYDYRINQNILVGIYRVEILRILGIKEDEARKVAYDEMIKEISQQVVEVKPGRKYCRRRMHSMNKYRHNLRRNS